MSATALPDDLLHTGISHPPPDQSGVALRCALSKRLEVYLDGLADRSRELAIQLRCRPTVSLARIRQKPDVNNTESFVPRFKFGKQFVHVVAPQMQNATVGTVALPSCAMYSAARQPLSHSSRSPRIALTNSTPSSVTMLSRATSHSPRMAAMIAPR